MTLDRNRDARDARIGCLLSAREAALRLGIDLDTLLDLVRAGNGPSPTFLDTFTGLRFRPSDLDDWRDVPAAFSRENLARGCGEPVLVLEATRPPGGRWGREDASGLASTPRQCFAHRNER